MLSAFGGNILTERNGQQMLSAKLGNLGQARTGTFCEQDGLCVIGQKV